MFEIIKYYVLHRHGLPILAISTIVIIFHLFIFQDDILVLDFIFFALMYPYLDMFSEKKENHELKKIDIKLPLSFNKIWVAKTICLSMYLVFLTSVYYLVIFYRFSERAFISPEFTFNSLLLFMLFFVIGKIKLYKRGKIVLIAMTVFSLIFFFILSSAVLFFPFILRPMDSIIPYTIITFLLPLAIVHWMDYALAKSKNVNMTWS